MKIWQRYFIKETLKVFFLIIICFIGVYILIDYASHPTIHRHVEQPWKELFRYYAAEMVQRIDVLIPFALLIATIRTLCHLRSQNELTALLASGVKLRKLLRPFVVLGILSTLFIYINMEFFIPNALTALRHINDKRALEKSQKNGNISAKHAALQDGSFLVFQNYDPSQKMFFDAYWVRSADDIYRIKFLYPDEDAASGEFVEHFSRNGDGELTKSGAFENYEMPELVFNKKVLLDTLTSPEEYSLTTLWKKHRKNRGKIHGEKEVSLDAVFYRKLAIPWFCLLAVIAPAPFCVRFARGQTSFFIYAVSIFAFLACFLIIDAAWIFAERQVFPPEWAIGVPFACLMTLPLVRYSFLK